LVIPFLICGDQWAYLQPYESNLFDRCFLDDYSGYCLDIGNLCCYRNIVDHTKILGIAALVATIGVVSLSVMIDAASQSLATGGI